MLTSNREKYLGDIITSDCKINSNVEERYNKGIGIANQIIGLLKEISFGKHYFQMAVMFRQSMLINSILCNSEVLYGLNKTHIETLESVDTYFWRNVFGSIVSTPLESYFIETNSIPIRYIIMARRLMYYWNVLQKDDTELIKKVFMTQRLLPCKNDWVTQLKSDLNECNITLSEEQIKSMKKEQFKNLVKKQIRSISKLFLISLREKHSKSENLLVTDSMKEYLNTEKLTTEEKKLLFAMKTRTVNVKTNFRNSFTNLSCRLCEMSGENESEIHLLKCGKIQSENNMQELMKDMVYKDIFGTIEKQIYAIKVWKKVFKIWLLKLEKCKMSPSGRQAHQLPSDQSASYTPTASAAQTVDFSAPEDDSISNVYDLG